MKGPFKFINKIGVELEGGWMEPPEGDYEIHEDISVKNGTEGFPRLKTGKDVCAHWGEIASKPLSLSGTMAFLDANFPDDTNASCGFHIHVSVKRTIDYSKLMKREFFNAFLEAVGKWAEKEGIPKEDPFWGRLEGKNRFARKVFRPQAQVAVTDKNGTGAGIHGVETRRTLLNYCWSMHRTLECRLFPGWKDKKLCKSAVEFFVNFVEGYLQEKAGKKLKLEKTYMVLRERDMNRKAHFQGEAGDW